MLSLSIIGIVALAVCLVWLGLRANGASRRSLAAAPRAGAPLPPIADEFLDRLDRGLSLPAGVRTEIRAELADHIRDSVAAIEAEGLDSERAIREALARLGRPEELARQLRDAHHSTRRLLAGAAGGVFQAGIGIVQGYVLGFFAFLVLFMLATTALRPVLDFLATRLPQIWREDMAAGTALGAVIACLPAFVAGRRSVRGLMRGSQRVDRSIAIVWAIAGSAAAAYLLLFVVAVRQSWLAVGAEALVPLAFAFGVLFRRTRSLPFSGVRVPRLVAIAAALSLPAMVLAGAAMGSSGTGVSYRWDESALDVVGPAWSDDSFMLGGGWEYGQVVTANWTLDGPGVLDDFHDVRIEVWRGVPIPGAPTWVESYLPDPAYSTPFAVAPVAATGDPVATFDLGHIRSSRWCLFVTGVAPDGIRYRLSDSEGTGSVTTLFSGTIWDWLTAAD